MKTLFGVCEDSGARPFQLTSTRLPARLTRPLWSAIDGGNSICHLQPLRNAVFPIQTQGRGPTMRIALVAGCLVARLAAGQELPDAGLVYSGLLLGPSGQPFTQPTEQVGLTLWDSPTGGQSLCVVSPRRVELQQGRFSVQLTPSCNQRLVETGEVFLELLVGNPPTVLPRTAVSAVPSSARAVVAGKAQRTVARQGNQAISGNGLFCGAAVGLGGTGAAITHPSGGGLTGYKAWRAGCVASAACGNSPTAHPCTSGEMLNSHLLGLSINSNGWVVTMTGDDCNGFTSSATTTNGTFWTEINPTGVNQFLKAGCFNLTQFLCCD
jgi:hypothetical protein